MIIRLARVEDLPEIAKVHFACFPNSFSTALGRGSKGVLLHNYYLEYLRKVPELFFVAESNGEIVGFSMGYYCEDWNYSKPYLRHNFLRICCRVFVLLVTGNRLTWRKLKNFVFPKKQDNFAQTKEEQANVEGCGIEQNETYPADKKGELLSICVLSEYRGTGISDKLIEAFVDALKDKDRKGCNLTVLDDNERGMAFYKRKGFVIKKRTGSSVHMTKIIE